jgi:predicted small lipoprotein YifL
VNGEFARNLRLLAVFIMVTGVVAACGRKGALEPPPKADIAKAQGGPAAQADAENQAAAQADQQASSEPPAAGGLSGLRAKKPPPVLPPKQPFFMDPILE